jgi:hypothetical protein
MLTLQAKNSCRAVVRCYLCVYRAMIIAISGPYVKSPQRGRKSGYFGGQERTHTMQCVASKAFAWLWRDHHNAVWNERASFEHGDRLQEVTIDMLTVPPIRTR